MKIKYEVISLLAGSVFRFLELTCKFKKYNYKEDAQPCIYAIWHGLQYCLGGIPGRNRIYILISQSKDGEIVTYIARKFGFSAVRGSMGRGGMKATREIVRTLNEGGNVAYTVDGPKGPGFKVKNGLLRIAQISKMPIIPVNCCASLRYECKSWDKYEIPLPGAKLPLFFGDPIYVPQDISDEEFEEYRLKVEKELFNLREQAVKQNEN